jgi:flavin-binding monooxygenase-like protein
VLPVVMRFLLRLYVGSYEIYGLKAPAGTPLDTHPTLNSSILEALRHGRIQPRVGIDHFNGDEVHFSDGRAEKFDAIIWGTGFRTSFPFLPASVVHWETTRRPPLYPKMMHRSLPSIFFIGLFQPIGCIWNLADYQARIAVEQIIGRLERPRDIEKRIAHEMSSPHWRFEDTPRHAVEVDWHDFRRELLRELASGRGWWLRWTRRPQPRHSPTRKYLELQKSRLQEGHEHSLD